MSLKDVVVAGHWAYCENNRYEVFEKFAFNKISWVLDEEKVIKISNDYFPLFVKFLNSYHKKEYPQRYWEIICKTWFIRIIRIVYFRYKLINDLNKTYENSVFYLGSSDEKDLYSFTDNEIWDKSENDQFNNEIYKVILNELKFNVKFSSKIILNKVKNIKKNENFLNIFKNKIKYLFNLLNMFNKGHICSSYLPLKTEIKLNFLLKQFPTFIIEEEIYPLNFIDLNVRKHHDLFINLGKNKFDNIIGRILVYLIPSAYLENYNFLKQKALKGKFPLNPKFIFTSNSYDNDILFKIYAAENVQKNSKLFIGQHGNMLHTKLIEASIDIPELHFSDKYFSWGNVKSHNKIIPVFPFTIFGEKNIKPTAKKLNLVTIVMKPRLYNRYTWDVFREHKYYKEDVEAFHNSLNFTNIHCKIKPHPSQYSNKDFEVWTKKSLNNFLVWDKSHNFKHIRSCSDLMIFSYDSTGIIESFVLGIPAIAFWNWQHHHIYKEYESVYKDLLHANVFFNSPTKLANFLNKMSLKLWWESKKTQKAVNNFLYFFGEKNNTNLSVLADKIKVETSRI